MLGKNQIDDKKRQLFRKEVSKYILDEKIGFVFLICSPIKMMKKFFIKSLLFMKKIF